MKNHFHVYIEDQAGFTWLTGEVVKSLDPLQGSKWELSIEVGDFIFYGSKTEFNQMLKRLAHNLNQVHDFYDCDVSFILRSNQQSTLNQRHKQ